MTRLYSIIPILRGFFLALAIVFLVGEVMLYYMAREGLALRLNRVEMYAEYEFSGMTTELIGIDDELEKFRIEVYPLVQGETDDLRKALIIKAWVMNQASKVGLEIEDQTPYRMLAEMREGRGACCGNMAKVYLASLKSVGIDARLIKIVRSIYGNLDTHAVVEVLIDGKYVIIDPTFNCYFLVDGAMSSASDLHQLLLGNANPKNFEVVYGGEVSYPAELETYYPNLLTAYNNVFVIKRLNYSIPKWSIIVPWYKYYSGSSIAAIDEKMGTNRELKVQQYLVIAYDFVFPIGFISSVFTFTATFLYGLVDTKNKDKLNPSKQPLDNPNNDSENAPHQPQPQRHVEYPLD